jgi:hypothetical protein
MAWIKDEIGRAVGLPAILGGIPLDEIGATGWGLVGDARLVAANPLDEGIYVVGFSYPVVPVGQALISAAHEPEHLERAVTAFVKVGRAHGVIGGHRSAPRPRRPRTRRP